MAIVLIIVKGFEERGMSNAFVWLSGFRVAAGRDIDFIIGEQVEVVALQRCGEVVHLFGEAVRRMRFRLLIGGLGNGFVDIWEGSRLLTEVSSNGNDLISSEEQEKEVLGAQADEMWMVICGGSLKWKRLSLGRELAKFVKACKVCALKVI